jgi:hypothetical protein
MKVSWMNWETRASSFIRVGCMTQAIRILPYWTNWPAARA